VQILIDRFAARHGGGLLRLGKIKPHQVRLGKIKPHQVFVYLGKLGVDSI
jgi:hypothetical protein